MKFRAGTLEDGLTILADLREQQCKTLRKLEIEPEVLLRQALAAPAITVLIDDHPAAMYGIKQETLIGLVKIWLITTPLVEREPIAFLRNSRRITKEFYEKYGTLIGMVDCDFQKSKNWLSWCGFYELRRGPEFIVMGYSGGN